MFKKLLLYKSSRILFMIFSAVLILFILVGYFYYSNERNYLLSVEGKDLGSISSLKQNQVLSWYNERLDEARFLNENNFFKQKVCDFYLKRSTEDSLAIYHTLYPIFKNHGYRSIYIIDKNSRYMINLNPDFHPDPTEYTIIDSSLSCRRIVISDITKNSRSNLLFYDIVVPIELNNIPIAAVVFNIDPDYVIFPYLENSYVITTSRESFLFRTENDSILFISPVRFSTSPPLTIKYSINDKNLPAAIAAKGYNGIFTGIDYRGEKVLADVRKITGTPWYLITKQDISEILKPLNFRLITFGAILLLIFGLAAVIIFFYDNKQNLENLKKIQNSELKFSELVEQASDGILVFDNEFNIIEVNSYSCQKLGYSRQELLNLKLTEIIDHNDLKLHPIMLNELLAGETIYSERILLRKDRTTFTSDVSSKRLPSGNILVVARDITERKKFEEELITAKEKAEEMNRLKSSFLANMSHELRTPLVGILGYAEILSDEIKEGEQLKMVKDIAHSGKRLLETLNSILDLSRIEANKFEIKPTRFNLVDLVKEEVELYKRTAQVKNIYLNIRMSHHELIVNSDRKILQNTISHLINNAVKFTSKGGIIISLTTEKDGTSYAVIKVADTGIGIPEESLKLIFEEFRQASEGSSRKFEGSGLGLTITKKYVTLLNGTIDVKSKPGVGSEFSVKIPINFNNNL